MDKVTLKELEPSVHYNPTSSVVVIINHSQLVLNKWKPEDKKPQIVAIYSWPLREVEGKKTILWLLVPLAAGTRNGMKSFCGELAVIVRWSLRTLT